MIFQINLNLTVALNINLFDNHVIGEPNGFNDERVNARNYPTTIAYNITLTFKMRISNMIVNSDIETNDIQGSRVAIPRETSGLSKEVKI